MRSDADAKPLPEKRAARLTRDDARRCNYGTWLRLCACVRARRYESVGLFVNAIIQLSGYACVRACVRACVERHYLVLRLGRIARLRSIKPTGHELPQIVANCHETVVHVWPLARAMMIRFVSSNSPSSVSSILFLFFWKLWRVTILQDEFALLMTRDCPVCATLKPRNYRASNDGSVHMYVFAVRLQRSSEARFEPCSSVSNFIQPRISTNDPDGVISVTPLVTLGVLGAVHDSRIIRDPRDIAEFTTASIISFE